MSMGMATPLTLHGCMLRCTSYLGWTSQCIVPTGSCGLYRLFPRLTLAWQSVSIDTVTPVTLMVGEALPPVRTSLPPMRGYSAVL
jgi:hypothetical protein